MESTDDRESFDVTAQVAVKPRLQPVQKRSVGRPSAQQASELTGLIVSVARHVMIRQGFDRASVDEIVAHAKISKKTFYVRFANKGELFEAVCLQIVNELTASIPSRTHESPNLQVALRHFSLNVLRGLLKHEVIEFERMVDAVSPRFPMIPQVMNKMRLHLLRGLRDILREADRLQLLSMEDVEEASQRFWDGAILPVFRRASSGLHGMEITPDDQENLDRYIRFFLRGYAPTTSSP